jgi:hypothetical protein
MLAIEGSPVEIVHTCIEFLSGWDGCRRWCTGGGCMCKVQGVFRVRGCRVGGGAPGIDWFIEMCQIQGEGVACSGCSEIGCSVRGLLGAMGWVSGAGGGCCVPIKCTDT